MPAETSRRAAALALIFATVTLGGRSAAQEFAPSSVRAVERVSVTSAGASRDATAAVSTTGCRHHDMSSLAVGARGPLVDGTCAQRAVSDDGGVVTFVSRAQNLVDEDLNPEADVFIWRRDPPAGQAAVIRVNPSYYFETGPARSATISPNGAWVAFERAGAIHLYDLGKDRLHTVPRPPGPATSASRPSVADDGSVTFVAMSSTVPSGSTPAQVWVSHPAGSQQEPMRVTPGGPAGSNMDSQEPWISGDARRIVFVSSADPDLGEDPKAEPDLFVWERAESSGPGAVRRITGDAAAVSPTLSSNGEWAAFVSSGPLSGDADARPDVYRVALDGGATRPVVECRSCHLDEPVAAGVPSVADDGTVWFQTESQSGPRTEQIRAGDKAVAGRFASVAGNGRYLAFTSGDTDHVEGDRNRAEDVYLRDLRSGRTVRVNVGPGGREAQAAAVEVPPRPAVAADGSVTVFVSESSNLGGLEDDLNLPDVFVHSGGITKQITRAPDGTTADGASSSPGISADGNSVMFVSRAANLLGPDTYDGPDVFVHDRGSGLTRQVSGAAVGAPATDVEHAAISPSGRWIAWSARGAGESGGARDPRVRSIWRHDAASGATEMALSWSGPLGTLPGPSEVVSVADDGSIAFGSSATNLTVHPETYGSPAFQAHDLFVVRPTGEVLKASVGPGGFEADNHSWAPSISADGRYVAFMSQASNLEYGSAGAPIGSPEPVPFNVFVRDLREGTTRLVSAGLGGSTPDGSSGAPTINGDGAVVAFSSTSANLVPGDGNGLEDVFVADLDSGVVVRFGSATARAGARTVSAAVSASGTAVAFESAADDLVAGDSNGLFDTFVGVLPGRVPRPVDHAPTGPGGSPTAHRSGYWMLGADGRVYRFGEAGQHGEPAAVLGSHQAVDLEPTPSGEGYWVLDDGGRVHAYGDAVWHGHADLARLAPGEGITSLSATPSGQGYWIFTSRGRVLGLGAGAHHLGDLSKVALNGPVLDSVATPSGRGYYMVASDGGIFTFGDAVFVGSMGQTPLNAPVQSLVPDADGDGYWLVASDGGIFAFDAVFRGSLGAVRLNGPVTGMVRSGPGYLMVGEDGGIFTFSDRPFLGSLGDRPPARPIVAVAVLER